jgi:8-amino-7-oxononanoate synthase
MSERRGRLFGLDANLKAGVIAAMRSRPGRTAEAALRSLGGPRPEPTRAGRADLSQHPIYQELMLQRVAAERLAIDNPFFRVHEGPARGVTRIAGQRYINFASYNYLDLVDHPEVAEAARAAIATYGTSASASRPVGGERPIHAALERNLAEFHGTEAAVAFVSGHATNVSVIGKLFGPRDLVVHDALAHNSIQVGAQLSGAARRAFAHNDASACEKVLREHRGRAERALVVIEGLYSMDGDVPDLAAFVALARRYEALLMVDEAHSAGVLGATGRGLAEHSGVAPGEVDIWMGTLSKSFVGCGGYIAGAEPLVAMLKFAAPGFLYSVGMAPPLAAASNAALDVLRREPERVRRLQANGRHLLERFRERGLDTGTSHGFNVVPVIVRSSIVAARLANWLFERQVNVQPIIYPAVEERAARLRFFVTTSHEREQLDEVAALTADGLQRVAA